MPHRYQFPLHTSAVSAPTRELRADKNGQIELPANAPQVEHEYLRRAGCQPIADGAAKSAARSASTASAAQESRKAEKAPQSPENRSSGDVTAKAKPKG